MNAIGKLLLGERSPTRAEKLSKSGDEIIRPSKEDFMGDHYLFFTTYPDCGISCKPFLSSSISYFISTS